MQDWMHTYNSKGLEKGVADSNLYIRDKGYHQLIMVVYVDDIISEGSSDEMCIKFVEAMQMSMLGELSFFFGFQITQTDKGIFIHQTKYLKEMLKKFQMEDCNPTDSPMVIGCKLSKNDESPLTNQTRYRSVIGSLLYLTTSSPDMMHVVCMVARFQVAPKETHVKAITMIFEYLQHTKDYELWYPKGKDFNLRAYTDVYWAGCVHDKKRTSDGAFFLGKKLVSQHSKKQDCVSLSTTKVEYIVVTSCCTQLFWMKHNLRDIKVEYEKLVPILYHNTSVINISKNPVMHSKMKHIAIKHHFLREKVVDQEV